MIKKASPQILRNLFNKFKFSNKSSAQRLQQIRTQTPLTQYSNLNPITKFHLPNQANLITDKQTKLRFLIQKGGFPGCSDLGIGIKLGTQDEDQLSSGSLNYLKNYVHMKPEFEDIVKNYQFLHQTGSSFDFNFDVINSYAKCSFFQEDFDVMTNILLDLALRQKQMFEDNYQTPEILQNINQMIRVAAFGNKGIGMPTFGKGNILTNQNFIKFQQRICPENVIISMSNLSDSQRYIDRIKQKIKQKYPSFLKRTLSPNHESKYQGGLKIFNYDQEFFQFALAFPSVCYKHQKMELYNILRIILGTASSFSSGGPGKGMHSRCTKNLMNKIACVENASFINDHFQSFGLFGITVGGQHSESDKVVQCAIEQFKKLRFSIPEQQLNRAKNILMASVYTNIQRQSDRLQQMTKHIYCYGRVRLNEYQEKIRSVSSSDIKQQMDRIFNLKPTFVFSGNNESLKKLKNYNQSNLYSKLLS